MVRIFQGFRKVAVSPFTSDRFVSNKFRLIIDAMDEEFILRIDAEATYICINIS
jgi:hypothetical protein